MVCVACLVPLFLVPIVSFLPILFDYIMMKVYALFGWEYRKPVRAPPACPIKTPSVKNDINVGTTERDPLLNECIPKQVGEEHNKNE